ncbi:PC4-domain-containing protein, partial [Hanseniaspora valbyensis NRRL Y-1626]
MESSSAPGQYKSAYKKYNRWNKWNNKNKDSSNSGDSNGAASGEGSGQKTALLPSANNNNSNSSSYNNNYNNNNSSNYSNNNNNNNNSNNSSGSSMPEASFDLGKNKRVTVRQFRNVNLIDIREYYKDSAGELRPGKKGISLTEEMFDSLLSNYRNIDDALRRLGSNRTGGLDSNAFNNIGNNNNNNAQNDINNNNSANGGEGTAGTLLIDNSGTVKNEGLNSENVAAGNKRKNG